MVQSINVPAIKLFMKLLFSGKAERLRLTRPVLAVKNLSGVDWGHLQKNLGIRCIILDKDNTITAPYVDSQVHPLLTDSVTELLNTFGETNVAILSNSAGTLDDSPNYTQAKQIEKTTGIVVIRHDVKKPGGLGEVLSHFNGTVGTSPPGNSAVCAEDCAIVGDRILTDVVFGNLCGMMTIHVEPLTLVGDNFMAKWMRRAERKIFPF
jgi:phosphatidylglycerophosphatase GEP4